MKTQFWILNFSISKQLIFWVIFPKIATNVTIFITNTAFALVQVCWFFSKVLWKSTSNPKFHNFRDTHWFYIQFQSLQIHDWKFSKSSLLINSYTIFTCTREFIWREIFLKVFSHEFADFEIEYKINDWL
jgi:hypothetical protein